MLRNGLKLLAIGLGSMLLSNSVVAAPPPPTARLIAPTVQLWYEGTGRLSGNILSLKDFALWNIIIGEGSAEEVANDAVFSVIVLTKGQQNIAQPLVLTATDAKGKVLAKRSYTAVLTNDAGKMHAALWVKDIGCAGPVRFVATLGSSKQIATLDFACGE